MRKGTTYIDQKEFLLIIDELKCPIETQSAFIKCRGPKGLNVYVAKAAHVGRVDISGFKIDDHRVLSSNAFTGAVTQQLDFTRTKEEILDTFRRALITMATLPPREEKRQLARQAKKVDDGAKKLAKEARLALIKKVAQEKGVAVSPQAGVQE